MKSTLRALRALAALVALALAMALFSGTYATSVASAKTLNRSAYLTAAAKAAQASKRTYGVPISVTVAQSLIESAWGQSSLTREANNYFGIKCGRTVSPHQNGCITKRTAEYTSSGKRYYIYAKFRRYTSMEKSFLDHGRLLATSSRYAKAFKYKNDPNNFIRAVHKGGYATLPTYASLIISVMKSYNLYKFDAVAPSKPKPPTNSDPKKPTTLTTFLSTVVPLAQANEKKHHILASVAIAQAMQESNTGKARLVSQAKNYFGMVCSSRKSRYPKGCVTISGTKYRKYTSAANSFADQAFVITSYDRYAAARKVRASSGKFLAALVKAGWSSDKRYVSKITALIKKYNLTKYDLANQKKKPTTKATAQVAPTAFRTTLSQKASGAKVKAAQLLLNAAGAKLKTTGYFGTDTLKAVQAFQKATKLKVTGRLDPATFAKLVATLNQGNKGPRVEALHALLANKKYATTKGAAFGPETKKSVVALQKRVNLDADGVVGQRTWAALFAA